MNIIEGRITSADLGLFGSKEMKYGYITLATTDGQQMHLKVDAYGSYETLQIGDAVEVEYSPLKNTKILVARTIHKIDELHSQPARVAHAST
jgi:hypothetical protein